MILKRKRRQAQGGVVRSAIMALCNEEAAAQCGATRGSVLVLTEAVFSTCASLWLACFSFYLTLHFLCCYNIFPVCM